MSYLPHKIFVLLFLLTLKGFTQTGPGGVGSSSTNVLWLKSEDLYTLSDGDNISSWSDISGNGNDVSQPNSSFTPVYKIGVLNGFPVVRFEKANGRLRKTNFIDFPTSEITAIYVNKNAESNDGVLSYASTSGNNDFLLFSSNNLRLYRNAYVTSRLSFNDNNWHITNASWQNSGGALEIWKDGSKDYTGTLASGSNITAGGSLAIAGEQDSVDGGYDASQSHFGDFAEVMLFNTYLNEAQQIIVSNYLAVKYGLSISNDYYSYESEYGFDLAGIGREDASSLHTDATSDGILNVSNPSGLNLDNEYLMFGHDDGEVTWTTVEAPESGVYVQRLTREWRLDETGDVGAVDFSVDTSNIPNLPGGHTLYALMIDADGDFSSGASVYEMSLVSGDIYGVPGVEFNDGDYVSIAAVNPVIQHSLMSSSDGENIDPSIEVLLNFIPLLDKTVEFTTSNGAANEPGDYISSTNVELTITAGTTSENYSIDVIDDMDAEGTETIISTLSNPIAGLNIGANSVYTYSILDNDISRKVYLNTETASGDESVSIVTVNLTLNEADMSNLTTVDYSATRGTATGSGEDFSLGSGTATFAIGTTTTSFDITINDDTLNEIDETILIELSNPTNSNLDNIMPYAGTGFTSYTYTINDNDNNPEIGFTGSSSSGSESVTSVDFEVGLDFVSGIDASATYVLSGSSTSGSDYLLDAGTVTVSAGETTANISATIINDGEVEFSETLVLTLTGTSNADLSGSNFVFTYKITDDDVFGYTGPGGVGDSSSNILWLDANEISAYSDNDDLLSWPDVSGNSNTFSESATFSPIYKTGVVNGYPVARFNKTNNRIRNASFSGFATSAITSIFVNSNNGESDEAQLSYASPTKNNDFLLFNSNSLQLFIEDSSLSTGVNLNDNNWHILDASWQSSDGAVSVWKDGGEVYSGNHQSGSLITDGGSLALAGEQDSVDGGYLDSQAHKGDHPEVILYNVVLNDAQKIIVANYLSAKYDIAISNDIYDQDDLSNGNFDHNVAGIGRAADGSFHIDSRGNGIIRMYDPNSVDINDFLFWGRDNTLDYTFADNATYQSRISSKWRVTKQNDIGAVTVEVDLSGIDISSKPACSDIRFIVDNDSDMFSPTIYPLVNTTGNLYEVSNVSFVDGDYFTLEYVDKIVVDGSQFYNGTGVDNVPSEGDDCYKLLVKNTADGSLPLSENAHVNEIEIESGGVLTVASNVNLQVTDIIENNGEIRMIGTSQLIQTHTGINGNIGSGTFYIDQQGNNSSKFRYNYWSSPVSSSSTTYSVSGVLKDGSTPTSATSTPPEITFTSENNGDSTTTPITISSNWIYKYDNSWSQIGEFGDLNIAEGFSMKGPGTIQNYTFVGEVNNGDYELDVANGDVFLLGNPYPSALDADAFITYNSVTNSYIDGSIYFWEHNGETSVEGDEGHYKSNYQGGYAVRNIGGGVAAVAPTGVEGLGTSSGDVPGQYIPVGQGFFVNANESGVPAMAKITFNNSMRAHQIEDGINSIFFKGKTSKNSKTKNKLESFRLGFEQTNENGVALTRQLLAVFKEGLSTGYDNGYDSGVYDIHGKDAYWKFSEVGETDGTYVIAGLDTFEDDVKLPLEVVVDSEGVLSFVEIEKVGILEKAFLYDELLNIYYSLENQVSLVLEKGTYSNRFYVAFKEEEALSIGQVDLEQSLIIYADHSKRELLVHANKEFNILSVIIYDLLGLKMFKSELKNSLNSSQKISIEALSPGVYVVQVRTNKGMISKKILIK